MIYLISGLYFLTRLINLTKLPIFNDEAIYLDWGQRAILLPNQLFYSLFDSKQPLLIWLFGLSNFIIKNPLIAGRLISVLTGFLSLLAIYLICKNFLNLKTAYIACFIYIMSPIFVFFDRQALMESSITAVGLWSLFFYLKLVKEKSIKFAVLLGIVLGLGFFVKTNTIFFALIILMLAINNLQILSQLFITLLTSQIILLPLYLQDSFWSTLGSNSRYSLTISEIAKLPITIWLNNLKSFMDIGFWQLSPFLFILIFGIYLFLKNQQKKIIFYWFILGILMITLTARDINPRYLVPFLPLILIFGANLINQLSSKNKIITYLLLGSTTICACYLTLVQIISPLRYFSFLDSYTRQSQKLQYVTGWTSGYAIPETISYLKNKKIKMVVGVRLDTGNPESAVFAYFRTSKNIFPIYFDAKLFGSKLDTVDCLSTDYPFYFVSRDEQLAGLNKYLVEEKKYYKPENKSYVGIYKLKSNCQGNRLNITL